MKNDFLKYQAQTSPYPLGMEVSHASGSYIYDTEGNAHLDFVAGVSACTLGHCHPEVVTAMKNICTLWSMVNMHNHQLPFTLNY